MLVLGLPPGRSAGSTFWCTVEAVVSTTVFVYAIMEAVWIVFYVESWCGLRPPMLFCTGCVVWTGISHYVGTARVEGAVGQIRAATMSETSRVRCVGPAGPLHNLDGVDMFEYHDITTMSLKVLKGVSVWLLFEVLSTPLVWLRFLVLVRTCRSWSWGMCESFPEGYLPLMCVTIILCFGCYARLLSNFGVFGQIRTLGEPCRTQVFYFRVQTWLSAGSIAYAALVYLSPVPSMWRWSLIVTHTARAFKVLDSLPHITRSSCLRHLCLWVVIVLVFRQVVFCLAWVLWNYVFPVESMYSD